MKDVENVKIVEHIDNIEQDFRMLDNIFKCMNVYWRGEGATAIMDTYKGLDNDIESIRRNMLYLKENIATQKGDA